MTYRSGILHFCDAQYDNSHLLCHEKIASESLQNITTLGIFAVDKQQTCYKIRLGVKAPLYWYKVVGNEQLLFGVIMDLCYRALLDILFVHGLLNPQMAWAELLRQL